MTRRILSLTYLPSGIHAVRQAAYCFCSLGCRTYDSNGHVPLPCQVRIRATLQKAHHYLYVTHANTT